MVHLVHVRVVQPFFRPHSHLHFFVYMTEKDGDLKYYYVFTPIKVPVTRFMGAIRGVEGGTLKLHCLSNIVNLLC